MRIIYFHDVLAPKKSGDSMERIRSRRSNTKRQPSRDLDQIKPASPSQRADTKDVGYEE